VTDSLNANVATISLSGSTVTLSTPPNSGSAWAGPYQSQSAVLRLIGTLSTSVSVLLPRAGLWIVENLCTVGSFVIFMGTGSGQFICPPPGEAVNIYCDGTNTKFVNLGRLGSYMDIAATAVPAWITASSVPPFLNCDGSTFSAVTYPALNALLGGTTLPDLRGRVRAALNQGTGRISNSGVNGNVILSSGGADTTRIANSNLPANIPYSDPGHNHGSTASGSNVFISGGGFSAQAGTGFPLSLPSFSISSNVTSITINPGSANSAMSTIPPVAIGGLTLIRAG
jgi:microcystin-dependent protein